MRKDIKLDIAINCFCSWFIFVVVSTVKQALKECKTFDFSASASIASAVALKKETGLWVE